MYSDIFRCIFMPKDIKITHHNMRGEHPQNDYKRKRKAIFDKLCQNYRKVFRQKENCFEIGFSYMELTINKQKGHFPTNATGLYSDRANAR